MNIFIPSFKDPNPYLDEIMRYSKNKFIFDNYKNYSPDYQIVNIHWPEAIFDWKNPTPSELEELKKEIKKWKQYSTLIYTFHDERSHFGMSPVYLELFELIRTNADAFIHLGEYSKKKMEIKFPKAVHKIILHPTYEHSFKLYNKSEARKNLNIDLNSLVILAPGMIRNLKEKELVFTAFNSIYEKKKVLICNNMLPFHPQKKSFGWEKKYKIIGSIYKFVMCRLEKKYNPPHYIFNFGFSSFENLSNMISAADIILIPRIDSLNSGNVYLGLTYKKFIIGPAIGNIKESLQKFNFPMFDPSFKKSIKKTMKQGVNQYKSGLSKIDEKNLGNYHPQTVAKVMDDFFEKMICQKL